MIGVGVTGFIQFFIVLIGSTVLIVKAIGMSSREAISQQVPIEWFRIWPAWQWPRLGEWSDTSAWVLLVPVALTWVIKGLALGVGGPQQLYDLQRFLAARNPREASMAGMIWGVGLVPMFMVSAAVGVIGLVTWGGSVDNPAVLYPLVIGTMLPVGLKGLVLAGLLSAFMSTFSATVNAGASYLTFDLYAKYLKPEASERHLVRASRVCSLMVVVGGVLVGMAARNINDIFDWIMMVLGTGVLIPNVLRWFWWRFNGPGFAIGTLVGVSAAIGCAAFFPAVPDYVRFPVLLAISLLSSILATLLTPPTDSATLDNFHRRVRPYGIWGIVRKAAPDVATRGANTDFAWDAISAVFTAVGLQALFLISTYAVTHQWSSVVISGVVLDKCSFAPYFTWYLRLPDPTEGSDTAGT